MNFNIHEFQHFSWLMRGDFNEILYESEKIGGSLRSLSQMSAFSEAINSCKLLELNCIGDQFTWCNRRQKDEIIFERFDRFLCNFEWQMTYPSTVVKHLKLFGSDHRLISINTIVGSEVFFRKGSTSIYV